MNRLLLLRHAKAAPGPDDAARPLTARGMANAEGMGRRLRAEGIRPDAVLCSTAQRTRETAAALAAADSIHLLAELYLAEAEEILAAVRHLSGRAETLMVVGHNPGIAVCARMLAGPLANACADFPTCTLADFAVASSWRDLTDSGADCRLLRCLHPA